MTPTKEEAAAHYAADLAVAKKHGMVPPERYAEHMAKLRAKDVALSVPNGEGVAWFLQAEQLTGSVRAWKVDVTIGGLAQFIRGMSRADQLSLIAALFAKSADAKE